MNLKRKENMVEHYHYIALKLDLHRQPSLFELCGIIVFF
jgi:hypothetical protein